MGKDEDCPAEIQPRMSVVPTTWLGPLLSGQPSAAEDMLPLGATKRGVGQRGPLR